MVRISETRRKRRVERMPAMVRNQALGRMIMRKPIMVAGEVRGCGRFGEVLIGGVETQFSFGDVWSVYCGQKGGRFYGWL